MHPPAKYRTLPDHECPSLREAQTRLLALALTALGIGIASYLDSRIPRATAVVEIHPAAQIPARPATFSREGPSGLFNFILAPETLRMALEQLQRETVENPIITASDIESLAKNLQAEPRRGTDFIEITVKDESRENAVRLANAVARAFIERFNQAHSERNQRILEALDEEVLGQEDLIQENRKELIVLIQQYGFGHSSPFETTESEMLENARKKLEAFKNARDETKIQIKHLYALKGSDLVLYATGLDLPENHVTYYHSQYKEARAEKRTLSGEGLNPDDDKLVAIEQQINQLEEFMQDEITSLKTNLQTKLELIDRQIERMDGIFENRDSPNPGHASPKTSYHRAKEAYEQSRAMLREMKIKQQEARALLKNPCDLVTLQEEAR